ncbi:MAG: nucleotidyl transferase AbiEii/AbiGii toxin family protein [Bdellovibrionales bacterium]|nr:nucleotidyl transferase AbiEii/AbiGii toxin family protein [Bdellovibrionales bacterium]
MEILRVIRNQTDKSGICFLVIGGHAVNHYGFARQTGDLDLLASKEDREFWNSLLADLKFTNRQNHEVFARFEPREIASWPIDLMFVEKEILKEILARSEDASFGSVSAPVPCIEHMIALKLHALKQRQSFREEKDFIDVQELRKRSNLSQEAFRALCEKYDRIDVYERLDGKK